MRPAKMLGELLRSLFRRPATVLYPFERLDVPEGFRGRVAFDPSSCVGCKLCMRDCPSGAIRIAHVEGGSFLFAFRPPSAGESRGVEIANLSKRKHKARLALSKCIYCSQCAESCVRKALATTKDYELAALASDVLPEPEPPAAHAIPKPARPGEPASILVVDDDLDFAEGTRIILESKGYRVVLAHSGAEGLRRVVEAKPALIILDVIMNKRAEGFLVARRLRRSSRYAAFSRIPILMLTGMRQQPDFAFPTPSRNTYFLPVDDFVEKPVKADVLLEKVEALLAITA